MNTEKEEIKKKKIGVYICHCGGNISDYVDVEKVKNAVKDHPGVELVKITMFTCSDASQVSMVEDIKEKGLDAMVVASCSPKLHLSTFRDVAKRGGLSPYNYIQVNIREQASWAHSDKPVEATEKAIHLVIAGIEKARRFTDLKPIEIEAVNTCVVIGAGISGMRSAIELADMGTQVFLIEKDNFVGGRVAQWGKIFQGDKRGDQIAGQLFEEVKKRKNINLFTGAQIISLKGNVGNFELSVKITPRYVTGKLTSEEFFTVQKECPKEIPDEFNFSLTSRKAIYKRNGQSWPDIPAIDMNTCEKCDICAKVGEEKIDLEQKPETLTLNTGAILVNTGFDPYEPEKGEFGYGNVPEVITLQQLMRLIELNHDQQLTYDGKQIKHIAFIYCVGSRKADGVHTYCSRFCCTGAIHAALLLQEKYQNIRTFHLHKGIRTYGKQEILYDEASRNGNLFLQFDEDNPPLVETSNGKINIKITDILTENKELELNPDLVVLVTGMDAREDKALQNILKIPQGSDRFFNEVHMKLRPVETVMDGIFIAGASQGPKNITETMFSTLAASAKANALISKGTITLEPNLAVIDEDKCTWCEKCDEICTYGAIQQVEKDGKTVAEIINASCKGCGACLPVCPEDAIELLGYTNSEIEAMIDAIAAEIEVSEKDSETKISTEKETEVEDDWLVKVEKLDENGKRILEALESKQKSIPEIVEETKIPAPEVTYRLMSLRKYGYVKDTNEINEDEYYEYALNH